MTNPKVLMDQRSRGLGTMAADPDRAWRAVGWLGVLLAVAGLGDFALAFVPTMFHSPEWEFGTVAAVFAGLPLPTLGLAGILASAYARGTRWLTVSMGALLTVLALAFFIMLVLFLTDIPIALKSGAQAEVMLGLKKAIVKTSLLGLLFSVAYLVSGIGAFRRGLRR